MKKRLFIILPILLALVGFISCSEDTKYITVEPDPPVLKEITHQELIGHYKVISCVSTPTNGRPVSVPDRAGEIWVFEENTLTVGNTDAASYTYKDNIVSTTAQEYTVDKEDNLIAIFYKAGDKTIILLLEKFEPIVYSYTLSPTSSEQNAYIDTYLNITFDKTPTLGSKGSISIYKKDGTKVDEIKLDDKHVTSNGLYNSTKLDIIGLPNQANGNRLRAVNYYPVSISGNTVKIKPHYGVLEYDTEYYVTIDADAVVSEGFEGITENEWTFKTKATVPALTLETIIVDDDGQADFRTIQAAIDHAAQIGKDNKVTIYIKNGVYEELLYVRSKNNLTIRGESREGVIIRYDNCDALNPGVGATAVRPTFGEDKITNGGRAIFLVETANNLRFENLTMENTHIKTGTGDQAEVIYFNATTSTLVFVNCNLISKQDTINVKGYCWFYNSLIAGDVDFIWGGAVVALFEECEIRSVSSGGYVLQARVPEANKTDKGFVFLNCSLTKGEGVIDGTTYLGRSSYNNSYYDNIAFINCKMDSHISTKGWQVDAGKSPTPAIASINGGWKEYGSTNLTGGLLDISNRLENVQYQLTTAEFEAGYQNRTQIMEAYTTYMGKDLSWMQLP
ncbi:MAG: pectinesterase family protein [Dysgonomonas sp.]|nr:pectinesterase family protein [Dysgonomonas sp.]